MSICLRRREFIVGLGGSAVAGIVRPGALAVLRLDFDLPLLLAAPYFVGGLHETRQLCLLLFFSHWIAADRARKSALRTDCKLFQSNVSCRLIDPSAQEIDRFQIGRLA